MSFSEQLKKARLAIGYTQQQVADAIGITNSTYCGYETGKRQPDVFKIKQLAAILKTSGDFLLETGFETELRKEDIKKSPEPATTDSGEMQEEEVYLILKKTFSELNIDVGSLTERQKAVLEVLADMIARNF